MVQVLGLEKPEQIIILIPEKEIKVEGKLKKKQPKLRLSRFSRHAKYHEELICIDNLKNKLDANLYRNRTIMF